MPTHLHAGHLANPGLTAIALAACLAGCASSKPAVLGEEGSRHPGYDLMLDASACWLGGIWSDAEGGSAESRKSDSHRSCQRVLMRVYDRADKTREEQLRALEAETLKDLTVKVGALATASPDEAANRDVLVRLVELEAAVTHETLYAHRAADRVKLDIADERRQGKLMQHEVDAVPALRAHDGLKALLEAELGPLTHDARAVALLFVMGRMDIAHGLPKHLKVYAVADADQMVFGTPVPSVPEDANQPLQGGAWLAYLSDVAQAGGYPVPANITDLHDREVLAWNGVGNGLADKLRAEEQQLSGAAVPRLRRVLATVAQRLTTQYQIAQREAGTGGR